MKRSHIASDDYGIDDLDDIEAEAKKLRESREVSNSLQPQTQGSQSGSGTAQNANPSGTAKQKSTSGGATTPTSGQATSNISTACTTCGMTPGRSGTDPRQDDSTMEKFRTDLNDATVDELRAAATKVGMKNTKSNEANRKKGSL
mgnify:CR=1 FL=1